MVGPIVAYAIYDDDSKDLVLIPDHMNTLHAILQDRAQVQFLSGIGAQLVKVTLELVTEDPDTVLSP